MNRALRPHAAFALLSLVAVAAIAVLSRTHGALFEPYAGRLDPLPPAVLIAAVGAICLPLLRSRGRFEILATPVDRRGMGRLAALATLFAAVAIVADLVIRFPRDLNVAPPEALMFYPAMAYVVEVVFHVLPLTLLLAVRNRLAEPPDERVVWWCILATALLEPTVQLLFQARPRAWAGAFVWVHVFAFNIAQLRVFRRYGFVPMYALRFCYYLCWHIAWGVLRLPLLFP